MQKIVFELGSEGRKPLVAAVGEAMGVKPEYQGAPNFLYNAAGIIIDRDGTLSIPPEIDLDTLLRDLAALGFAPKEKETEGYVIELPLEGFTDTAFSNLEKLIQSKGNLIQKALCADSLVVEKTADTLRFPWFRTAPRPEEAEAYTQFLTALCETAKTQQRVTAAAREVENEKYAFRCFLLKLGFIGDEYRCSRALLLSRLSGNSAFKYSKKMRKDLI